MKLKKFGLCNIIGGKNLEMIWELEEEEENVELSELETTALEEVKKMIRYTKEAEKELSKELDKEVHIELIQGVEGGTK